jgi:hypothetical protein
MDETFSKPFIMQNHNSITNMNVILLFAKIKIATIQNVNLI